jgi:hypothetical protein
MMVAKYAAKSRITFAFYIYPSHESLIELAFIYNIHSARAIFAGDDAR